MNLLKKKCKHYPVVELSKTIQSQRLFPGLVGWSWWPDNWFCYHCKKPMKAVWKVSK